MEEKTLFRIDPSQLAVIRRQAGLSLSVNSSTTPLEAGMQLGMARVLHILQEGFTVDTPNPNTSRG